MPSSIASIAVANDPRAAVALGLPGNALLHANPHYRRGSLTVDARSGAVRRTETFADQTRGQRARRWLRLLHTGEALGWSV